MVLYRANEWNNNVTAAIDGNFDLLPTMLPSSSSHVFTKDPTAYNSQLKGYEEVIEILGDGFLSAIQAY